MGHLEEMQVFVRVVEAGGIARAAEQIGIAKSAVSRRMASLEARLGVRLINRTTRRSSLTEPGRKYYDGAVKLIGDISELDGLLAEEDASLKGSMRVTAPLSFGVSHLSAAIDLFVREHPELTIHIDFSDHQVDLVRQGIDVAIRIAELKDSSLKARRICPIRVVLCASPAYLERHGTPKEPAELARHRFLGYDSGAGTAFRLADGDGGEVVVRPPVRMVANNGDFLRDMAVAGHGIVVLPTFIAWHPLAMGELVPVMASWHPPQLDAWAVYPPTRYLSKRVRLFIDFLAERFGERPYWDAY